MIRTAALYVKPNSVTRVAGVLQLLIGAGVCLGASIIALGSAAEPYDWALQWGPVFQAFFPDMHPGLIAGAGVTLMTNALKSLGLRRAMDRLND